MENSPNNLLESGSSTMYVWTWCYITSWCFM